MRLNPALRAQLRFIAVADPETDLSGFPEFLVVGPPRTGTHWLATNLSRHPELFLPREIVETYYFSSLERPPGDFMGLPAGLCADLGWYMKFFWESPEEVAAKNEQCLRSFQRGYRRRMAGEATSVYALGISTQVLDEILLLAPDLKVILTVRNPIERTWSNAKLELCTRYGCRVADVDPAAVTQFVKDPYHRKCGDYLTIIRQWQSRLRPGHLLVRSFEFAQKDPAESLREVYRFLGVEDAPDLVPMSVATRVNASEDEPVPECYRGLFDGIFADQVAQMRRAGLLE